MTERPSGPQDQASWNGSSNHPIRGSLKKLRSVLKALIICTAKLGLKTHWWTNRVRKCAQARRYADVAVESVGRTPSEILCLGVPYASMHAEGASPALVSWEKGSV